MVVGSGIAVASTGNAPVASWVGLLEHGIQYCLDHLHQSEESEEWARIRRDRRKLGEFTEVAVPAMNPMGIPD